MRTELIFLVWNTKANTQTKIINVTIKWCFAYFCVGKGPAGHSFNKERKRLARRRAILSQFLWDLVWKKISCRILKRERKRGREGERELRRPKDLKFLDSMSKKAERRQNRRDIPNRFEASAWFNRMISLTLHRANHGCLAYLRWAIRCFSALLQTSSSGHSQWHQQDLVTTGRNFWTSASSGFHLEI